jgi:uncharacterized protein YlxW (UPF0749 family)
MLLDATPQGVLPAFITGFIALAIFIAGLLISNSTKSRERKRLKEEELEKKIEEEKNTKLNELREEMRGLQKELKEIKQSFNDMQLETFKELVDLIKKTK